jgi:hypothetical protein
MLKKPIDGLFRLAASRCKSQCAFVFEHSYAMRRIRAAPRTLFRQPLTREVMFEVSLGSGSTHGRGMLPPDRRSSQGDKV